MEVVQEVKVLKLYRWAWDVIMRHVKAAIGFTS